MKLSGPKILIASNGRKTYAIVNGTPAICEELAFSTDGINVTLTVKDQHLDRGFTVKQFEEFLEDELGYKLRSE